MKKSTAYLLVVHGSRSFYYAQQLRQLANQIQSSLHSQNRSIPFITAYLELAEKPLHEEIIGFAREYALKGYQSIKVLPLFLLSGAHVLEDIPEQLSLARANSPLPIELVDCLGKFPDLVNVLRTQFLSASNASNNNNNERILLAHGTRLKQGQQELGELADQLDAKVAYWSIEPNVIDVIKQIAVVSPQSSITVLPYFLFTGKITDTIVSQINELPESITSKINILPTLAKNELFANLITQYMLEVEERLMVKGQSSKV